MDRNKETNIYIQTSNSLFVFFKGTDNLRLVKIAQYSGIFKKSHLIN